MTKATRHTPGPWHIGARYGHLQTEVLGPTERAIATVWTHAFEHPRVGIPVTHPHPEGQANATLIAAAPELLEACEALDRFEKNRNDAALYYEAISKARLAIAQATP